MRFNARKMALCAYRHNMPDCVHGSIFPKCVNPTDICGLTKIAVKKIQGIDYLDLYVTGLTQALGAVINACIELNVPLTLWHYDKKTEHYYAQPIKTEHQGHFQIQKRA